MVKREYMPWQFKLCISHDDVIIRLLMQSMPNLSSVPIMQFYHAGFWVNGQFEGTHLMDEEFAH